MFKSTTETITFSAQELVDNLTSQSGVVAFIAHKLLLTRPFLGCDL